MKKRIFLWSLRTIFLLSLFSILFCGYQIYLTHAQVSASLKEWENKKDTAPLKESPVSFYDKEIIPIKKAQPEQTPLYSNLPATGAVFGKITFPKIKKEFPIVQGTDQEELAKGVGHYMGSVLPGEHDNTVLAGHRDTVFKELGRIGVGDIVEVETEAGRFTYKITRQRIVHKDDRTVIVPYDYAAITLITCYPFDFVGPAPDRFILVGELQN
ncbi:class D sortase [Neobacillus sp. GCM10023253]|uniref:class D sortase n=1 Tax=Neobacillus sp. GCM10023253 TaxID=3252644 RepID=UPI00361EBBB9